MTAQACTWPHCGCNSTRGNHCSAPSVLSPFARPAALAVPEVAALEKEVLRLKASLWAIGHAAGIETKEDLMQAALAALRGEGGNG